jgi:Tfp pilus assembly protein PilF
MSLQTQRAGEAIVYLNRALAIDSGSYETLALLATASKVLGKTDDARDFDQRASAARRALPRLNTGMGADLPGTPP